MQYDKRNIEKTIGVANYIPSSLSVMISLSQQKVYQNISMYESMLLRVSKCISTQIE